MAHQTRPTFRLALVFQFLVQIRAFTFVPQGRLRIAGTSLFLSSDLKNKSFVEIRSYDYEGLKLTYTYKRASKGFENKDPLFLIHPIGVGMSSWFWENYLESSFESSPATYCPDLIGCGLQHGADAWNPETRYLDLPLEWVKACEVLMNQVIRPQQQPFAFFQSSNKKFDVVVQGGLAPVGILLAHRNPKLVKSLTLCSPPTWKDMVTPLPEKEIEKNLNFLRSPLFGKYAFDFLESANNIRFFSNLFLFSRPCDEQWVEKALEEARPEARPPVQEFNAGVCMKAKSYEDELRSLRQPVLVLSGKDDTRARREGREEYTQSMRQCSLKSTNGKSVIPWEFPDDVREAVQEFTSQTT